jgi:hypothetical protein
VTVVEHEHRVARLGEALRKRAQPGGPRRSKTVAQHDPPDPRKGSAERRLINRADAAGLATRKVKPSGDGNASRDNAIEPSRPSTRDMVGRPPEAQRQPAPPLKLGWR